MALLLDGPPSTISDLSARDSDLASVSVSEGIDLTAKLKLAASDLAAKVDSTLQCSLPPYASVHSYAPALKQVAVTYPLKAWHTYMTLRMIYQDLYYSRLNDRYAAKMKAYRTEELNAFDDLRAAGLGIVHDPLPQATAPVVTQLSSTESGGTLYLAVSYLNRAGEEGSASEPIESDTQDGSATKVTLSSLAVNATGWNLYAGLSPNSLTKQNSDALDPLASITIAPGTLASGPAPGAGQEANLLMPLPRRLFRA